MRSSEDAFRRLLPKIASEMDLPDDALRIKTAFTGISSKELIPKRSSEADKSMKLKYLCSWNVVVESSEGSF